METYSKKKIVGEVPNAEALIHGNNSLRYNILSRKMVTLSSDGAKSVQRYKYLCREANRITVEINAMPLDDDSNPPVQSSTH